MSRKKSCMDKKKIFICKYAPVLMKIARKIMRYFLLFPLFFFRFFTFIHSISASVEMLHVSMHVLQHESVIKLHFVPETFYCYFLLLWLMAVCNMLSFVCILEYRYVCKENNDNNYELQKKRERKIFNFRT